MKNTLVIIGIIALLAAGFFVGHGCNGTLPDHTAQVKTVDSAAMIAGAAEKATQHFRDSVAPVMANLRDTITLLKKRVKPVDQVMDEHVQKITMLANQVKTLSDSTAAFAAAKDSLLQELVDAAEDYNIQQYVKDSLISKQEQLQDRCDSLQNKTDSLTATLKASLTVTQGAFNTTISEDATAASDLKIYKTVSKAEALAIAALIIKIISTNRKN